MVESVFVLEKDGRFLPTDGARGPWDPRALHGGAATALITAAFERVEAPTRLRIARLSFELVRPVPVAPLTLSTTIARDGRRVRELAAELRAGEDLVCRSIALCVEEVPAGLPGVGAAPAGTPGAAADGPEGQVGGETEADMWERALPGPDAGTPVRFALGEAEPLGFAGSSMEMRWLDDPSALGPARVWMRLRHPLVPGEPVSPLAALAAVADFGNGVSARLPFADFLFINADLTIHLHRAPRGEWFGIDARTVLSTGGTGLAESVLHDVHGPVGRGFQTLVVGPR
ncbi:MAG TPA: thioesterase family protein [Solirubrobacteraceae bacterium]|nr:thioesterase family protein [Solirubrobacteraceae bacterium]